LFQNIGKYLPRLTLRNRLLSAGDFKDKVPEISQKFHGIRYAEILSHNFGIFAGVCGKSSEVTSKAIFLEER
jgi:hypothetical protein